MRAFATIRFHCYGPGRLVLSKTFRAGDGQREVRLPRSDRIKITCCVSVKFGELE